jgi:hypothetical protein
VRANRIKLIGSNTALGTIRDSLTSFTDFQALAAKIVENPEILLQKAEGLQILFDSQHFDHIFVTFSHSF